MGKVTYLCGLMRFHSICKPNPLFQYLLDIVGGIWYNLDNAKGCVCTV